MIALPFNNPIYDEYENVSIFYHPDKHKYVVSGNSTSRGFVKIKVCDFINEAWSTAVKCGFDLDFYYYPTSPFESKKIKIELD